MRAHGVMAKLSSSLGLLSSQEEGFFLEHAKMHHSLPFMLSLNDLVAD